MKPFISLCMIVKNEEKVIDRCLSSIVNLIDEIIVVDTGSTDNTKELVSKYTSNIFDFKWIDDFSAARNFAASKARGKWILVLDADEFVDEENFKSFIEELKEDGEAYDAYTAKIINFAGNFGENLLQNYHERIYRNNGNISYHRKIHEQFKHNFNEELKIKKSSLLIFHSGYLNKIVKEKNKSQRNKVLLDKQINQEQNNAFEFFNYGNEYCSIGEYSKALDAYLKAYKLKRDFNLAWVPMNLIQIVICLLNLKRYSDALNVIDDAEKIFANSPEFPYLKGQIFLQRGQIEDAKNIFLELINNSYKYNHIIVRPDLKEEKPHYQLGEIFLSEENYDRAIYHFVSVLNINRNNIVSINKVLCILNKFYSENEIANFLKTNNLVNENNIQIYIKACFDIGKPSLALNLLEDYIDVYRILYKVALLKKICIENKGYIDDIKEILQIDMLKKLMESNWINFVDIILLRSCLPLDSELSSSIRSLKFDKNINNLIDLLDGNESVVNVDEEIIIYTLQTLFVYKKYDLCNIILDEIEKCNKNIILKVARILFSNEFKGEALQLYNLCDLNMYDAQDFVNIINSLLQSNNIDGAVEFAKYAMFLFEEDFRFYKYIIENSENTTELRQTLKKAKEIFVVSQYLDNIMF